MEEVGAEEEVVGAAAPTALVAILGPPVLATAPATSLSPADLSRMVAAAARGDLTEETAVEAARATGEAATDLSITHRAIVAHRAMSTRT